MNREARLDPAPRGVTTLDLLLFTAGFACGWVMHQGSALRASDFYILPMSSGGFRSLLGSVWAGWLWAAVIGLAFLIVGRRFRYDCRDRVAEWLAVALAIVLFESVYPAFRTARASAMTGETAWIEPSAAPDSQYAVDNFRNRAYLPRAAPLMYELWWPQPGESLADLASTVLRLTLAAVIVAVFTWRFRAKLSRGLAVVLLIVIAVLFTLGPMRLAEATSTEVRSSAPNPAYQPRVGEKPWSWPRVAAYFDARAWAGYSLRALALVTVAILAAASLVKRWRAWLWTEWAAVLFAGIIAGCWIFDEFFARPALDRTVRVTLLGAWLLLIASVAGGGIGVWTRLVRRSRNADEVGQSCQASA